jgi:hypothetical protein
MRQDHQAAALRRQSLIASTQHQPWKRTDANRDAGLIGDRDIASYKAELWRMADVLRGSMDAGEYKHVVPGLIFLKYISDAF